MSISLWREVVEEHLHHDRHAADPVERHGIVATLLRDGILPEIVCGQPIHVRRDDKSLSAIVGTYRKAGA